MKIEIEQVKAEPAGRQMDAWIAEYVMRWKKKPSVTGCYDQWDTPEGKHRLTWTNIPPAMLAMWSPSTNIAAAWEVVEKEPLLGFWQIWEDEKGWNAVVIMDQAILGQSIADTASLAICRAALLSVLSTNAERIKENET